MTTDTLHHSHHNPDATAVFGFWIYIMSDCLLFASLFAAFAVLHNNTFGGPGIKDILDFPYVFIETVALLASSFAYGMAMLGVYKGSVARTCGWLCVTFIFGLCFVGMELNEFIRLCLEGHNWQTSGALSAFFTLVGTHGLHVSIGLFWMLILIFQTAKYKINPMMSRRLSYLGLFWHFLDIVWIFVFTIVYLMGGI